jgi:hypothetical protein
MDEYKKYPIYKFTVWVKDSIPGSEVEQSIQSGRMFKEEQTRETLDNMKLEFIKSILSREEWTISTKPNKYEKMTAKQAGLYSTKSEVTYEPAYESWMLTWFSHETIDNGEDDTYFYNSFMDFCQRMKRRNQEEGEMKTFPSGNRYWDEPVCLMGAEDVWRWGSWKYDEGFDEKNPDTGKIHRSEKVPCRCIYCKKRGVVQINH